MDGFAELCGKIKDDSHLVCSAGLQLMTSLMSPYFCYKNFEAFRSIFVKMKHNYLETLKLESHLSCPKLVDCKRSSLVLLDIFIRNNPNVTIETLIESKSSQQLFHQWKSFNTINSHKAESIRNIDIDDKLGTFGLKIPGERSLNMKGVFSSNKVESEDNEEEGGIASDDSFGDSDSELEAENRKSGAVGDSPEQAGT